MEIALPLIGLAFPLLEEKKQTALAARGRYLQIKDLLPQLNDPAKTLRGVYLAESLLHLSSTLVFAYIIGKHFEIKPLHLYGTASLLHVTLCGSRYAQTFSSQPDAVYGGMPLLVGINYALLSALLVYSSRSYHALTPLALFTTTWVVTTRLHFDQSKRDLVGLVLEAKGMTASPDDRELSKLWERLHVPGAEKIRDHVRPFLTLPSIDLNAAVDALLPPPTGTEFKPQSRPQSKAWQECVTEATIFEGRFQRMRQAYMKIGDFGDRLAAAIELVRLKEEIREAIYPVVRHPNGIDPRLVLFGSVPSIHDLKDDLEQVLHAVVVSECRSLRHNMSAQHKLGFAQRDLLRLDKGLGPSHSHLRREIGRLVAQAAYWLARPEDISDRITRISSLEAVSEALVEMQWAKAASSPTEPISQAILTYWQFRLGDQSQPIASYSKAWRQLDLLNQSITACPAIAAHLTPLCERLHTRLVSPQLLSASGHHVPR